MAVLNFGSLNIDHVYAVDHVVRPGETLPGRRCEIFSGGKGANQSAALALAGAVVRHVGRVGTDGGWLVDELAAAGVDVSAVVVDPDTPTGHAVIQVEAKSGQNAIVLFPGANHHLSPTQIETCLKTARNDDIVLLQNEINRIDEILSGARKRGLTVCWNPAPFDDAVAAMSLEAVDLLVVNQTEASGLAGAEASARGGDLNRAEIDALMRTLRPRLRTGAEILLTLGEAGAILDGPAGRLCSQAVAPGPVVDTTAAGDTFVGYFLAARAAGLAPNLCLRRAAAAAGLCVTRPGARASIPTAAEVETLVGA